MIVAYEGFGVLTASTQDFEFYGLRTFSRHAGLIRITCGYIQPGMPPPGEYQITLPAKDTTGTPGQLIVTVAITEWELVIDGEYGKGIRFAYEGYLDVGDAIENRLDFRPETGDPVKVVDLK